MGQKELTFLPFAVLFCSVLQASPALEIKNFSNDDRFNGTVKLISHPVHILTNALVSKYTELCTIAGVKNNTDGVKYFCTIAASLWNETQYPIKIRIPRVGSLRNGTQYPKDIQIARDDLLWNGTHYPKKIRTARAAKSNKSYQDFLLEGNKAWTCKVSKGLKTAEILCKAHPSSVTCKSYCINGYTYNEGIVRTQSCVYRDNKWSKAFEECEPFVDCTLRLTSPGRLKCMGHNVKSSPKCEVACNMYEVYDELPTAVYTCTVTGTWKPFLPRCVKPIGIPLVKAPEVTEYTDVTYP